MAEEAPSFADYVPRAKPAEEVLGRIPMPEFSVASDPIYNLNVFEMSDFPLGRPQELAPLTTDRQSPWKSDPVGYYQSMLQQTNKLLATFGNSPLEINRGINKTYADIFANDGQSWMGLAVLASDKVGEGIMMAGVGW